VLHLSRLEFLTFTLLQTSTSGSEFRVLLKSARPGLREFGLAVEGALETVTPNQANRVLQPRFVELTTQAPYPFPLLVVLFTMQGSKGWVTWYAKPHFGGHSPHLKYLSRPDCQPLSDDTLKQMIDEIDRWWDAFYEHQSVDHVHAR
jgi:hypothetical protein